MIGTSVMKELAQNESDEKKFTYWQTQYYKCLHDFSFFLKQPGKYVSKTV